MIKSITIKNYKSIREMTLELGRVNIFIGENGAGKSNILEAIALAGAANSDKLDHEFLTSRGIRVTDPMLMRSAFSSNDCSLPIEISVGTNRGYIDTHFLNNNNEPYSEWSNKQNTIIPSKSSFSMMSKYFEYLHSKDQPDEISNLLKKLNESLEVIKSSKDPIEFHFKVPSDFNNIAKPKSEISDFVIFSPENSSLRILEKEGQILPLGINGEGLLKLLAVMSSYENQSEIESIKNHLQVLNWFEDFRIENSGIKTKLSILDQYIDPEISYFDQRSANEGFLFVTFYLALFASKLTPKFFAIDNIDASLNPKLCAKIVEILVDMAKIHNKQCILTTHNPATLDGINLNDKSQRLFVVSRNIEGETQVRRFQLKDKESNIRLSNLFISGALGGVPKNF